MSSFEETTERIKALRGLLERLCAPDLTLSEAKSLWVQLDRLLGLGEWAGESGGIVSAPVVPPCAWDDARCLAARSPESAIGAPI
jgi:hypothetical protein